MDLGDFPIPDEKQMSPSLPYFSLSCSLLTSLTLSIVNLCWRQSTSLSLSISGCPLPFFLHLPLHISLQVPLSPASQCLSHYLSLSQSLRPPPETSPSASPFPGAHRRNTSIMGRPKVPWNLVTWPERPPFRGRHTALMVRWNCKLHGLHPTAPVLSHGATKKQGNSVKWSVFDNSQLTTYSGRL